MEIPGGEFRIKNKSIREKAEVSAKKSDKADKGQASQGSTGNTGSVEQIALSTKAKDIQKAHEAVKASPDIRADKVDRIKAEIEQGRFHVDSDVLAERILKEIITDSKFFE